MALKGPLAFAISIVTAIIPTHAFSEGMWEPTSFLKFADHLYAQQDFLRAAGEYERYLVTTENLQGSAQDSLQLKISFCYTQARDFPKALNRLTKLKRSDDTAMAREARLNTAFVRFRMGDYGESIQELRDSTEGGGDSALRDPFLASARANMMLALNHLHLREWKKSDEALGKIVGKDTLSPFFQQFRSAELAGLRLPAKSPLLAGAMSAVIPGSGKMYAGRITDGMFSLAMVGLTGALAGFGFYQNGWESVEGWVLGSLALGLHGGNIYGSVLAAHQANVAEENRILKGLSFSAHASIPF